MHVRGALRRLPQALARTAVRSGSSIERRSRRRTCSSARWASRSSSTSESAEGRQPPRLAHEHRLRGERSSTCRRSRRSQRTSITAPTSGASAVLYTLISGKVPVRLREPSRGSSGRGAAAAPRRRRCRSPAIIDRAVARSGSALSKPRRVRVALESGHMASIARSGPSSCRCSATRRRAPARDQHAAHGAEMRSRIRRTRRWTMTSCRRRRTRGRLRRTTTR